MRFFKNKFLVVIAMIFIIMSFIGCSSDKVDKQSSTDNKNTEEELIITGLIDNDIKISIDELKELKPISVEAKGKDSAGKDVIVNGKGALLEDILQNNGKSQKDLSAIRLVASDGYSIEVPKEILQNRDIILAYEIDNKELNDETKPLRVLIPEERAMYWVRQLSKIEVLNEQEEIKVNKIVFFETAVKLLPSKEYGYKNSKDKAVDNKDINEKYFKNDDIDIVNIKAVDGLEKNEQLENFLKGNIKFTGEDIPAFVSYDLPVGMHVKDILWFKHGDTVFVSAKNALKYFNTKEINDKTGIALKDIFEEIGLESESGQTFECTASDDYKAELSMQDIENTIIYCDDKEMVRSYVDGAKNKSIKDLLFINIK